MRRRLPALCSRSGSSPDTRRVTIATVPRVARRLFQVCAGPLDPPPGAPSRDEAGEWVRLAAALSLAAVSLEAPVLRRRLLEPAIVSGEAMEPAALRLRPWALRVRIAQGSQASPLCACDLATPDLVAAARAGPARSAAAPGFVRAGLC